MKIATLELVPVGDRIDFRFAGPGVPTDLVPGPPRATVAQLAVDLGADEHYFSDDRARLLERYAKSIVPAAFSTWFRAWSGDSDEDSVLCVYVADREFAALPWVQLLNPSTTEPRRSWVARVCSPDRASEPCPTAPLQLPAKLLFAAWANLTRPPMKGVERESNDFQQQVGSDRLDIRWRPDPPRSVLLKECREFAPTIVHLSPPSIISLGDQPALPVTPEALPTAPVAANPLFEALPLTDLAGELQAHMACRLILMNACFAGGLTGRDLAHQLTAIAIGWPGLVADDTAASFAFYFHQRLREGLTPITAVRDFARTVWTANATVEFPVVWLPSPAWADWIPIPRRHTPAVTPPIVTREAPATGGATEFGLLRTPPDTPGLAPPSEAARWADTVLEFEPEPFINPALLVNLRPAIKRLILRIPTDRVGDKVNLCVACDTGRGCSTFRQSFDLTSESTPVPREDIAFPALYELVDRKARRRHITFTATVSDPAGRELAVQTKTATWMGATEWLSVAGAWNYTPAFVNPQDESVRDVCVDALAIYRTITTPLAEFDGYPKPPNAAAVGTQVQAIYQTLRGKPDGSNAMKYIAPSGSPLFEAGRPGPKSDQPSLVGQYVRTHGEVVKHRLGTCHDLALLLAACVEYVNIRPLLILVGRSHTFFGYWTSAEAQERYWKKTRAADPQAWTIEDIPQILQLADEGSVQLVEATVLGKPDKSFDDACKKSTEYLKQWHDYLDVAVDIYRARVHSIRPV